MSNETYHQQQNRHTIELLRNVLSELPKYVTHFFRGIENTTAAKTRLEYARDLKTFYQFICDTNPAYKDKTPMDIPLSLLDSLWNEDIEEYLEHLKLYQRDGKEFTNNERALKRKLAALRVFYAYLNKNGKITHNPAANVNMPKIHSKTIVRMEPNEIADFLDNVEYGTKLTEQQKKHHAKNKVRDLALLTLMLSTGIRVTECVGLDINDVDFENSRIKIIRKGGYEAFVYFGDEAADTLAEYMQERIHIEGKTDHENALFLSSQRSRLTVRSIENMVKKYSVGTTPLKKITPHKLRSTYGTTLYQETGDIYLVADVLGHKDVNTTKKHYADQDDNRRRSARNIVQLREKQ